MKRMFPLLSLMLLSLLKISLLAATEIKLGEEFSSSTHIHFSKQNVDDIYIQRGGRTLRPISRADLDELMALYENPEVMKWVGTGQTKSRDAVEKELKAYEHCWKKSLEENTISFNMRFVASIRGNIIGTGGIFTPHENWVINDEGRIELSGFGKPEYWNKGYGSLITQILIEDYIPFLKQQNFTVGTKPPLIVQATAHPDNEPANRILKKFFPNREYLAVTKYESPRNLYTLPLSQ